MTRARLAVQLKLYVIHLYGMRSYEDKCMILVRMLREEVELAGNIVEKSS
jgi:hypothetical protein